MNTADSTSEKDSKKVLSKNAPPKDSPNSRRIILLLLSLAVIAATLSSLPSVQNKTKALFLEDRRVILAKVNAFYGVEQTEYLILKLKDSSGIQIEIYEMAGKQNTQQSFKQKFELTQDSDAYITLDKSTTNLALSDVDKDGQLDILAPSVDRNGNLRLNTFRFNSELSSFEPLVEPEKWNLSIWPIKNKNLLLTKS